MAGAPDAFTGTFSWIFRDPLPEQTAVFVELAQALAEEFGARLTTARAGGGLWLRTEFGGDAGAAEQSGREFWLEMHSRCLDHNLALELAAAGEATACDWRPLSALESVLETVLAPGAVPPPAAAGLMLSRPPIPAETVYDLLRADDPELDKNLADTITWIEAAGLPVINRLSYLDLPLYTAYAADHPEEREQTMFLHMLHTWTCYRRFGAVRALLPESLAQNFTHPIYLRLNTTQFRSPAPALCVQFAPWTQSVRGAGSNARLQWAKEIYLTHLEPPTPADDRELTLMLVSHDERGEYGFIPLEVPLSLPGVGQSIDAFFAPSAGDEELGANTEDLRRLTSIAATYCLYATARDPARYLDAVR